MRALQGVVTLTPPPNAGPNAAVKVEYAGGKYDDEDI